MKEQIGVNSFNEGVERDLQRYFNKEFTENYWKQYVLQLKTLKIWATKI